MKRFILLLILICISFFIKIPEYVELNDLAIIEGIGISYNNNHYTIYLKEIIPIKDEQGINYDYKYYKESGKTLNNAYQNLKNKTKKKLYLKEAKLIVTNIKTTDEIKNYFKIKNITIHHTKYDILKSLKKST